jgi:hypothetical protein
MIWLKNCSLGIKQQSLTLLHRRGSWLGGTIYWEFWIVVPYLHIQYMILPMGIPVNQHVIIKSIAKRGGTYHPFENQVALLISRLWLNYKYYIKIGILVELHMNIKVRTLTCRHKNHVTTRIYQTSSWKILATGLINWSVLHVIDMIHKIFE